MVVFILNKMQITWLIKGFDNLNKDRAIIFNCFGHLRSFVLSGFLLYYRHSWMVN